MKILLLQIILSTCFFTNHARKPFIPPNGALPFAVYFSSRYRGMCMGTMISRLAVLTAAVCVTTPVDKLPDRRPINVVAGTTYRHPRRGIKVQVVKILIPKMPANEGGRGYIIESSVAVLLLRRKLPDALAEVPVRAAYIDYRGTDVEPALQEECITTGWHFFNHGFDTVYPPAKFLLKRYLRVQFLNVVKKHMWCEPLVIKFQASLDALGYHGIFEQDKMYCLRDPEQTSQPCHGMYGAPMICNGQVIGMMTAPDAQWTNCTGLSNIYHKISTPFLMPFWNCIAELFHPEYKVDMNWLKKSIFEREPGMSFESDMYDKVLLSSDSSSSE